MAVKSTSKKKPTAKKPGKISLPKPPADFVSGAGWGSYMKDGWPLAEFVLGRMVGETVLMGKEAALPIGGKPVVLIASHGSLIATLPAMALVAKAYMDAGLGDAIFGDFPHPALLWEPLSRVIFEKTGTPTKIANKDELVKALTSGAMTLAGTAPEGVNCHLQYREYVGPLRSRGMIAAGILSGAHICIMAHFGGDRWALRLKLPFNLSIPFTDGLHGVRLPIPPMRKIPRYAAVCETYTPGITAEELTKMEKREAHLALSLEAERIRIRLNRMTGKARKWVTGA